MSDSNEGGRRKSDDGKVVNISEQRRRIDDRFEDLENKLVEELRQKCDQKTFLALHKIQDMAVKWAKIQFIILSSAVFFVVGALGFFGYQSYTEYSKFKNTLATETANIDKKVKLMDDLMNEIGSEKLQKQLDDVDKTVNKLETLKHSMKNIVRSGVKLTLHYPELNSELRNKFIGDFSKELYNKGFILAPEQGLTMTINKSEIIYYHPATSGMADDIKKVLEPWYPSIEAKIESSGIPSAPNRILIKLAPETKSKI